MAGKPKHGLCVNYKTHPLYALYYTIRTRCYNASTHNFPYYQGKGIKLCNEWLNDIKLFIEWALKSGWKKGLSIDRIDSDKDYSPENCQWLTISENSKKMYQQRTMQQPIRPKVLTIDQANIVKEKLNNGMNGMAIAKLLNVSKQTIYRIRDNKYL